MEICHGAKVSRLTRSKSPLITDPRSKKKKTFPPSSFFHLLLPPPLCRATLRNSEKTLLKRVWAEITFPEKFAIARVNFAGIGRVSRKSAIIFNCSRVASRNENRGDVKIFDSIRDSWRKKKKKKRKTYLRIRKPCDTVEFTLLSRVYNQSSVTIFERNKRCDRESSTSCAIFFQLRLLDLLPKFLLEWIEREKGEREREGGEISKQEGSFWKFCEIIEELEIGRLKYVCADFRARCFATNATKCRAKEWIDINCKQCPIHHVKSIQRIVRSNIESNKRLPQLYQIIADLHIAFGVHVTIIHVIRCHRRPAIFVW